MPELREAPTLLPLFGKAALTGFGKRGGELPDTVYTRPAVGVDPGKLATYDRVCGFRLSDVLPATYPHVLGFAMQVKLLTDGDFPFPLTGSVHIANRITVRRRLGVDEAFELRVRAQNLRNHPRGKQFDVLTDAAVDGDPVWSDVSTYLRRGGSSDTGSATAATDSPETDIGQAAVAVWRVSADIGRRYAAVAGDINPIHLHPLSAKVFGFPTAIAHGMWTKARCLAALEGKLPDAYTVDVRFKRPVLLPAKVALHLAHTSDAWRIALRDATTGKPHLEGTITAAASTPGPP